MNGIELLALGPTLEMITAHFLWDDRAWTYQEAILSPRCIYISKYQVYFECNSMTCCESLDQTHSAVHKAQRDSDYFRSESYTQQLNLGILRNPITTEITDAGKGLCVYSVLSTRYSRRQMTESSDALFAFSGILQALEESACSEGFFWALPCAHIN